MIINPSMAQNADSAQLEIHVLKDTMKKASKSELTAARAVCHYC